MCEPMAIASLAVTAISTAVGMFAQNEQSKAQASAAKASAEYNAQVAANEAATQQHLAQNEIQKGIVDRDRHMRAASQRMGQMTSMLGASGFALDDSSALSLLSDSATEEQFDANIITRNAEMAAWGHEVAANNANNQKSMYDYQRRSAGSGGSSLLSMGGTLLGGLASGMAQFNSMPGKSPSSSGGAVLAQSDMGWDSSFTDKLKKVYP